MQRIQHVFVGDVIDQPVLRDVQGAIRQILAGAEDHQIVLQTVQTAEKRDMKLHVLFQAGIVMFAHEGLFGLKMLFGVVPHEGHGLDHGVLAFPIQNLFI